MLIQEMHVLIMIILGMKFGTNVMEKLIMLYWQQELVEL